MAYNPKNKILLNSTQARKIKVLERKVEFLEQKIKRYEEKFVTLNC